MSKLRESALKYHTTERAGKLEVISSKPCQTAWDLALAYTPGVAEPVKKIAAESADSYLYTCKGNLVAVVSNGTAILGLGNLGALASKPVMEGKAVLFKRFADIDVFDLEIDTEDPDKIIQTVKLLEPTFGGINLEDIKAPECFYIEEELKKICKIPVFHDDQHGTAIIASAGLINALEISNKEIDKIKVVFSGAGAAGVSIARLFVKFGVKKENITMCDIDGVVYLGRKINMDAFKGDFAQDTSNRTLGEAIRGADVFIGVSAKNVFTPDMLLSMNRDPIVFALANPDPEITYDLAISTRDDVIIATGRSDYPNQINNVLGFPFIFRGALDVRASQITDNMKIAAAYALAALAKEPVPDIARQAYNGQDFVFGRKYLVPKPFDPRIIEWEAVAVAKAAMKEGIAAKPIYDWEAYKMELRSRMRKFWI